jgi:hypothetical protein
MKGITCLKLEKVLIKGGAREMIKRKLQTFFAVK